jgi:acyl-CoA synthetase (AMP-forming)/AMP-acid ligase II
MTTFHGPSPQNEPGIGPLTFGGFLEDLAARYSDRLAIVYAPAGAERLAWTYRDWHEHSRAVAKALIAAGVTRGTRVAVLMGNRPEWVAAVWGAAMAGGVAVLFNTFATERELDHLLRHSDSSIVLTERALLNHRFAEDIVDLCPEARTAAPGAMFSGAYPFLRRIVAIDAETKGAVESWPEFLSGGATVPDEVLDAVLAETVPIEDGMIIYSSGTTSLPKGVLHRHRAPMRQSWRHGYREQFTPEDRVLCGLPWFWTAGFAAVLGATLATGGAVIGSDHFQAAHAIRLIEQERVTCVQALPNQVQEIQAILHQTPHDLSSIRRQLYRLTGEPAPNGEPRPADYASYGSSETFTSAAALPDNAPVEEKSTYGRLIAGSSMRFLDPATGDPIGPGQEGEIALKGLTLMRGYVKVPPEDVFDDEGYFHTGDLGFFDEKGLLHWTGRITSMIKTSGANVAPVEVEEVLDSHPDVKRAAVVGVPDPVAGELVIGCVVLCQGATVDENALREHARAGLSSYKVPRRILFFDEEEVEFTASEKVNLNALRELVSKRLEIDS